MSTLLGAKPGAALAAGAVSFGTVGAAAYTGVLPDGAQPMAHTAIGAPAPGRGENADATKVATAAAKDAAEATKEAADAAKEAADATKDPAELSPRVRRTPPSRRLWVRPPPAWPHSDSAPLGGTSRPKPRWQTSRSRFVTWPPRPVEQTRSRRTA